MTLSNRLFPSKPAGPARFSRNPWVFSHPDSHFPGQGNHRPQCAQDLDGSVAFLGIFSKPLPGYGLAAPVEEAAICRRRKLFGNSQQMESGGGWRVNFQPRRRKGRG
jgi:hypothetical protein